jgi:hypothetical protein
MTDSVLTIEDVQELLNKQAEHFNKQLEKFSNLEKSPVTRDEFETLKNGTEGIRKEAANLAGVMTEHGNKLNLALDEIRSIGGKVLEHVPIKTPEKIGDALLLLELDDD